MFPCSGCGLCCQNISKIENLKKFDLGNGVCKHYDFITRGCKIYQNRPNICNIEKMYNLVYFKLYSKQEFYKLNADVCNKLQDRYKLDKSYKIKIGV